MDRRHSASSIKYEIMNELKITISSQTVRRRVHELGFYGRVVRDKPYLTKANRVKRRNVSGQGNGILETCLVVR